MENVSKQGAEGVQTAPAAVEKEAAPACFRKMVGEDATFIESAKDRFRQFKDAPAGEHWSCFKNKVLSIFGEAPRSGSPRPMEEPRMTPKIST